LVQIRGKITRKSKFLGQLGIKMKKFEAKVWKKKQSFPLFPFSSLLTKFPPLPQQRLSHPCDHQPHAGLPNTTRNTIDNSSPSSKWSLFFFFFLPPPQPLHSKFACSDGLLKKIWWARPVLAQQIRLGWVQPILKKIEKRLLGCQPPQPSRVGLVSTQPRWMG
jgi:hypothetical protein